MMGIAMKGGEKMIKFEETEVVGWRPAIRGMRNPMNSWEKSDSHVCMADYGFDCPMCENDHEPALECNDGEFGYCIGTNDLDLMVRLRNAGTDHRKFMRMLVVYVDITAPLYWWKEFDTYKVGTVANSCSTMHKIHAKEFHSDDFSTEHLDPFSWDVLAETIICLNINRQAFIETKDKQFWWQMIQLLPTSYNQKRTVMLNYEVLTNMYHARKHHKLDEWHELCRWVETLPYAKELIIGE
jgi:hypothetical protein